jgi:hypothetical protein
MADMRRLIGIDVGVLDDDLLAAPADSSESPRSSAAAYAPRSSRILM